MALRNVKYVLYDLGDAKALETKSLVSQIGSGKLKGYWRQKSKRLYSGTVLFYLDFPSSQIYLSFSITSEIIFFQN